MTERETDEGEYTLAYQQGFSIGLGYDDDDEGNANPYPEQSDDWRDWQKGVEDGEAIANAEYEYDDDESIFIP